MRPILGITMGDPAGIGPELLLKTFPNPRLQRMASFVLFGSRSYLLKTQRRLGNKRFSLNFPIIDDGRLDGKEVVFGKVTRWGGEASGAYIAQAAQAALSGQIDGIVTLPINKQSFAESEWGKKFVDHTGMLAGLSRSRSVALMLVSGNLRAVHVTQHIPLKKVASAITRERVSRTILLTLASLKAMGIRRPKVAVCGLNPHAGDGGVIGTEELRVIGPAVKSIKRKGHSVFGPLSADAVWPMVEGRQFDAAVAMYHDQGQIPIKFKGKGVVNVTLGLPFVRTSVGHGTAYEIAGKGTADNESFVRAIEMAAKMLSSVRRHSV